MEATISEEGDKVQKITQRETERVRTKRGNEKKSTRKFFNAFNKSYNTGKKVKLEKKWQTSRENS